MKRRLFIICAAVFAVAALVLLLGLTNLKKTAPMSAIDHIDAELLKEGFQLDQRTMTIDEIVLGPANPAKTWLLSRIYPGYQTRSENRVYIRNGAKLGIDFGVRVHSILNVSLPADPMHCARARRIARELSAINPNLSIWLRTNTPAITSAVAH